MKRSQAGEETALKLGGAATHARIPGQSQDWPKRHPNGIARPAHPGADWTRYVESRLRQFELR